MPIFYNNKNLINRDEKALFLIVPETKRSKNDRFLVIVAVNYIRLPYIVAKTMS